VGDRVEPEALRRPLPRRCAEVDGLNLHADVAVPARDRERLERLARYVARPPLATDRLRELPDGLLLYELREPLRDGTTGFVYAPLECGLDETGVPLTTSSRVRAARDGWH
jgi:hypothetical protein